MEEQLEYSISLKSLSLENFRCFGDLDINFDERLTVIIAGNGGGKTAILDSIAESLKAYLAALHVQGYEKSIFKYSDITMGRDKSAYDVVVDLNYPVRLESLEENSSYDEVDSRTEEDVKLHVDINSDGDASFRIGSLSVTASFDDFASEKINKKSGKDIVLPILCYCGGDSVQLNTDDSKKPKNRLDYIYKEALSPSRINFTAFKLWFDEQYRRYLEKKVKSPKLEMQEIDPDLFKIINAVENILNDDTTDKMYQDLRMDYEGEARVVLGKQNEKKEYDYFDINQFSAGEKALFAFVADLGLRLLKATPLTTTIEDDTIDVIRGKGIVLIDEVDLHLHPKWQRKVVGKLMDIFPDVQFVMTTHSPLMLGGIPSKAIRIVDNGKIFSAEDTYGREVDDILEIVMHVDAGDYTQEIKKIARLIAESNISEAEKLLSAMQDKIDEKEGEGAGEEHPDIIRMKGLLTRKKVIGR
jgi:predicted ATP-binding protein involved in virulence